MSRPRLAPHPDPKVERRRAQYRAAKMRKYETDRHGRGECKNPCVLEALIRLPVPRKNGDGYVWLPA